MSSSKFLRASETIGKDCILYSRVDNISDSLSQENEESPSFIGKIQLPRPNCSLVGVVEKFCVVFYKSARLS